MPVRNRPPVGELLPIPNSDHAIRRAAKGPKPPQGKIAPLHPGLFLPPFDVIEQLTNEKDRYVGEKGSEGNISIYHIPSIVSTNLERMRARVVSVNKVGLSPAIACCASYGISVLSRDAAICELAQRKADLNNLDSVLIRSADDYNEVATLLQRFEIGIPDMGGHAVKKTNVKLPLWLKQAVSGLANDTGCSAWALLILACMVTLSIQPQTVDGHKEVLQTYVEKFLRRVVFRNRIAATLMELVAVD
jgi:hypothetical protein